MALLTAAVTVAGAPAAHARADGRPVDLSAERARQQAVQQLIAHSVIPLVEQQIERLTQNGLDGSVMHRELRAAVERLRAIADEQVPAVLAQIERAAAAPGPGARTARAEVRASSRRVVLALLAEQERLLRHRTRLDVAVTLQTVAGQLNDVVATVREVDLSAAEAAEVVTTLDRVAALYATLVEGVEQQAATEVGGRAEELRQALRDAAVEGPFRDARAALLAGRNRAAADDLRQAAADMERVLNRVAPRETALHRSGLAEELRAAIEEQAGLIARTKAAVGAVDFAGVASDQQSLSDRLASLEGAGITAARSASTRAALAAFRERRAPALAAQEQTLQALREAVAAVASAQSWAVSATAAAEAHGDIEAAVATLLAAWAKADRGEELPSLQPAVQALARAGARLEGAASARSRAAADAAGEAEASQRRGGERVVEVVGLAVALAHQAELEAAVMRWTARAAERVVTLAVFDTIAATLREVADRAAAGGLSPGVAAAGVGQAGRAWHPLATVDGAERVSGAIDAAARAWQSVNAAAENDDEVGRAVTATSSAASAAVKVGDELAAQLAAMDPAVAFRERLDHLSAVLVKLDTATRADDPKALDLPPDNDVFRAGRDATAALQQVRRLIAEQGDEQALRRGLQRTAVLVELERQRVASAITRMDRLTRAIEGLTAARASLRDPDRGAAAAVSIGRYLTATDAAAGVAGDVFARWQIADDAVRNAGEAVARLVEQPWLSWASREARADDRGLLPWPTRVTAVLLAGRDDPQGAGPGDGDAAPLATRPGGAEPGDDAGTGGGSGDALSSWDASLPPAIRRAVRRDRSEGVPELYRDRLRRYYESLE